MGTRGERTGEREGERRGKGTHRHRQSLHSFFFCLFFRLSEKDPPPPFLPLLFSFSRQMLLPCFPPTSAASFMRSNQYLACAPRSRESDPLSSLSAALSPPFAFSFSRGSAPPPPHLAARAPNEGGRRGNFAE